MNPRDIQLNIRKAKKMQIKVICLREEKDKIENLLEDTNKLIFVDDIKDIKSRDCIVLSSLLVAQVCKKIDLSKNNNLYLYTNDKIIDTNNTNQLLALRKKALDKSDFSLAKSINKILIDIDFIKKNTLPLSSPSYLQIESTSYCNTECIMCSHYYNKNKSAKHLTIDTLNKCQDAIKLSYEISLNGMGEPFISPFISDQIDFYASFGNRIVTNTNLSYLNARLLSQIDENCDWLEISIDGADKKTYEAIRKNLKFENLLENLSKLQAKSPNLRKHIASVIMRQNVRQMPEMVKFAKKYHANIITFMTLNSNLIIDNQRDEMSNYPKVLAYYSNLALEMGDKLGIDVVVPNSQKIDRNISYEDIKNDLEKMDSYPYYKSEEDYQMMMETSHIINKYLENNDEIQRDTQKSKVKCQEICDWMLNSSYIDLDGNVAMCCRNQSFHLGNVNKEGSFNKVWQGKFAQKIREIFYSGYLPESCLKCGLIESGNLKYLTVDINKSFYQDPVYKIKQKAILNELIKNERTL